MQAFLRSPASSPDPRTIYFFSDVGAGTVDHSVFTYTEKLNYFAAEVFPLGSSRIEFEACSVPNSWDDMEYWRKEKEAGHEARPLIKAKRIIEDSLRQKTFSATLGDTCKCLSNSCGVSQRLTLQSNAKFIFGGGGHLHLPYETGVTEGFNDFLKEGWRPFITSMQIPTDLEMDGQSEGWMKRLYVAYGLSFPIVDLAENTYPDQNILEGEAECLVMKDCDCRGCNPSCTRCLGRGWYYEKK